MKKRIVSTILSFCMLLSLFPMTSAWAANDTTELKNKLNKGGTVKLQKDYEITSTLEIKKDVTLDLNGYVIKMNSNNNVILVKQSMTFTLNDSDPTRTHTGDFSSLPAGGLIVGYSKTEGDCCGVLVCTDACLVMNGGTVMNCSAEYGGGICVISDVVYSESGALQSGRGGSFIMNGGTIRECHASIIGAGVFVSALGKMSMNGGVIENCPSDVLCNSKTVSVQISSNVDFYANGGVIKGNMLFSSGDGFSINTIDSIKQNSCTTFYGALMCRGNSTTAGGGEITIKTGVFYGEIDGSYTISSPYYTVSFDLNGGNGNSATQRFVNTNIAKALKPADPTKDGYAFLGWYNGNTEYKFDKPVTENISLEAKWESIYAGSESELKSKINSGVNPIKLSKDFSLSSTLDLSDKTLTIDLNGHVLGGNINIADTSSSNKSEITLIDSDPTSTHSDTSLPSGGVLKGNITLSRGNGGSKSVLNADGGSVTGSLNLHSYAAKVCTSNNNKTTTSFYGTVNAAVDNSEIYTGIYYKPISEKFESCVKGILLTFYVDNAEYCYEVYTQGEGSVRVANTIAPVPPTKEGYTFTSWKYTNYTDTIDWPFGTYYFLLPRSLNAAFSSYTYSISYELNGGTVTNPTTYTVESENITLTNPTKSGYIFTGWSGTGLTGENNMTVTIPKGSTGNRNYTAHYSVKSGYTVSFDVNDGNALADKTGVKWTDKILDVVPTPTKTGYTFKGWKHNNADITADTAYKDLVADDTVTGITLTAQWEENSKYTVTFDTAGGTSENPKTNVKWTDKVLDGISEPIRNGYEFTGWKCENVTVTADTAYAELAESDTVMSVPLTAQWKDITAPTGEITLGTNSWKQFLNNITFGLFFKDTQEVTVTATDNSGEDVTIEYLLSDKELSETALATATFTAYTGKFNIEPNNEYVIYAKLTDKTGNAAYINSDGIVLDNVTPVISGIADGKTYCSAQTVTVTEKYVDTVTVNGNPVTPDTNGQFTLSPAEGEQKIVVTDKAGNQTEMTVTVNDGHTYEWQNENGQYWKKCKFCNHETEKSDIPKFEISGNDTVCEGHDWKFTFTLPEGSTDVVYGYDFENKDTGDLTPTYENGVYTIIIPADEIENESSFKLNVYAKTSDGFDFTSTKEVTIISDHTGGTADCTHKAKCEICGDEYGEVNADNHTTLKHIEAKAATTEAEGNTEYWHCEECGKYFSDKDGKNEITLADTVIAKLEKIESPKTGDNSHMTLWIAFALVSGGTLVGTVAYSKKKKHFVN